MNLGTVLRGGAAADAAHAALTGMSETGDRHGAAEALVNLVAVLSEAGQLDEAVTAAREAVAQARGLASASLEGTALVSLAMALEDSGHSEQAAEALRDAAAAYHRGGALDGEADARLRLGNVLRDADLLAGAVDAYRAAAHHYHRQGTQTRRRVRY